ncbi:MAG TPA: GntR family transcriptional regulator [Candidatus Elarobacter sp.]|nr:GntR family transcriptional regulator [Candidatus Elarobacter sp.]HEV2740580.1 GntR family transcriptional regulator [Candidatus Elarobacter sp.]
MRRPHDELADVTPVAVVRHPRMKEGIVDSLRRAILDGKLAPGTVLRQEHLARQLNVSRTPLREALIALEREGFITIAPSGAASVVSLDARDALEIMDLREMVDGLAARLLAQRGMSAELDRELTALAKMMRTSAARDQHQYLVANADFHVKIVEATGHARLQQFIPLVRMSAQVVYLRLQNQGRRLTHSADEHARVLGAIRAGDAEAAECLAREHVRNAAAHWLER